MRAWRAADRYDPLLASLRTWLFAILRNVVVDLGATRSVRPALAPEQTVERETADTVDEFDRALASWQVEEALLHVSDEHRLALVEVHVRRARVPRGCRRSGGAGRHDQESGVLRAQGPAPRARRAGVGGR